jgi:hypothetical protein
MLAALCVADIQHKASITHLLPKIYLPYDCHTVRHILFSASTSSTRTISQAEES